MEWLCEWCGKELPEEARKRSGRRQRFCGKPCRLESYRAADGVPVTRRHCGRAETSDRLYTEDELEFLKAVDRWRREHDRRIPNCTEILAIARDLGYRKHPVNSSRGGDPNICRGKRTG